ncbi:MAG: hypothetical protein ABEH38_02550, partial [Flavobacteriales bacterium]
DTIRVKDYLLAFRKAHVETYQHKLSPHEKDSILKAGPVYRLRVIDAAGDTNELKAYTKSPPEDPRAMKALKAMDGKKGKKRKKDVDRMYALTDKGKFAIIQRYVFGRYFQPISEFQKDYSGRQRGYRRLGPTPPQGYPPVKRKGPKGRIRRGNSEKEKNERSSR